MNDARKADRLRVVLLARYREPTMLDLREAECRDLSLGGMFVATARPSPRGGLIRFECDAGPEAESFRGTARVVWQRSKPDPRGPAGMGVRFVHLEPSSREALSKLVARVAQSPHAGMPAAHVGGRTAPGQGPAPAAEIQASVLPIGGAAPALRGGAASDPNANFNSTQHGLGGPRRSPLGAPTLRGVAMESDPPGPEAGNGGLDRAAIRRASAMPDAPMGGSVSPMQARVRTEPPNNLVSNPDRPRSDRPPAAPPVNDEPAWSMPARARPSERPVPETLIGDRPGRAARDAERPGAMSERPFGATAPGLGGGSSVDSDPAPIAPAAVVKKVGNSSNPPPRNSAAPGRSGQAERPRERSSERPPAPGGIDVLRPQTVVQLPTAAVGDGATSPPASNGSETAVWHGQRASTDPGQPPGRMSWEPPPGSALPVRRAAAHHAAEEAEVLETSGPIPRLSPPRSPLPPEDAPTRSWGGLMLWLVVGSGLVVAVVLSKLFGGAPPAIPENAAAVPSEQPASETAPVPLALRYRLVVMTDPPGAKVTVAGSTLVAPAEFGLAELGEPLVVSASLDGRMSTSIEVSKAEFIPRGDHFEREVRLTLPPVQGAEPSAPEQPARAAGSHASRAASVAPEPPPGPTGAAAESSATPSSGQPLGSPVLPDRPRALPRTDPTAVPAAAPVSPAGSAVGESSSLSITPSAATGSLATVTSAPETAFKRATDCLLKGDNACVIKELEPNARTAQELELLIETYRAVGDQGNAERHMTRYVANFANGRRTTEYKRLLQQRMPAAAPAPNSSSSTNSSTPVAAPGASNPPAQSPSNPPAPPMPPEPTAP